MCALAAGVLCTLLDQVHVRTATLGYPHAVLFGQDWWVLPNFMLGVIPALALYPWVARAMGEGADLAWREGAWRGVAVSLVLLSVVYASSGVFNQHPRVLLVAMLAFYALRMGYEGSRSLLVVSVLMAIGGSSIEASLCALGKFYYRVPDGMGVPMWLPGVYLHGAFALRAVMRAVMPEPSVREPTGAVLTSPRG